MEVHGLVFRGPKDMMWGRTDNCGVLGSEGGGRSAGVAGQYVALCPQHTQMGEVSHADLKQRTDFLDGSAQPCPALPCLSTSF